MTFIPKQPKHVKERIEAKLDQRLVQKLEQYCEYLESDRDYVISQVLEIAFKKDKGFGEWLVLQTTATPVETPDGNEHATNRSGRRPRRAGSPQGENVGTGGTADLAARPTGSEAATGTI